MVDEKFHSYVFDSLNPRTSLHCYFAAEVGAVHVGTRSQSVKNRNAGLIVC